MTLYEVLILLVAIVSLYLAYRKYTRHCKCRSNKKRRPRARIRRKFYK